MVLEGLTNDSLVLEPGCRKVLQVVTHWRCGLLLAYKGCERSGHSQIYVGDIAKDLAMWEQDVRMAYELDNGCEV